LGFFIVKETKKKNLCFLVNESANKMNLFWVFDQRKKEKYEEIMNHFVFIMYKLFTLTRHV